MGDIQSAAIRDHVIESFRYNELTDSRLAELSYSPIDHPGMLTADVGSIKLQGIVRGDLNDDGEADAVVVVTLSDVHGARLSYGVVPVLAETRPGSEGDPRIGNPRMVGDGEVSKVEMHAGYFDVYLEPTAAGGRGAESKMSYRVDEFAFSPLP